MLYRMRDPNHQIVVADGPADEIVRAEPGRLDRRIEVAVRREHQDRQLGAAGLSRRSV